MSYLGEPARKPVTVATLAKMKAAGEKFTVLTRSRRLERSRHFKASLSRCRFRHPRMYLCSSCAAGNYGQ